MATQTPTSDKKTISSRLASMKFMQRAVASETSSPTTPVATNDRSAKRRKSSHVVTPGEIAPPVIDKKAVQAALEKEEQRRQAAIKIQAEEAGDSHWVLPGPFPQPGNGKTLEAPLKVRYLTQAQIDYGDSDEEDTSGSEKTWRKQTVFRRYNMPERKVCLSPNGSFAIRGRFELTADQTVTAPTTAGNSDDGGDSSDSEPSHHPAAANTRRADPRLKRKRSSSEFSTRRKAENERAHKFAEERRKKDVKLNQLPSISGISSNSGNSGNSGVMRCYNCNKTGHKAAMCPSKTSKGKRP